MLRGETRRSDVNDRLPYFNEMTATLARDRAEGAFEGVPPAVLRLMDGMTPTGLNENGELVVPRRHCAENGPLVLVHRQGEQPAIRLGWSKSFQRTIDIVLRQANVKAQFPKAAFAKELAFDLNEDVAILNYETPTVPDKQGNKRMYYAPRVLLFASEACDHPLTSAFVVHELDHWDFFLNTNSNTAVLPGMPWQMVKTLAERRAYGVEYQVERNLGLHALLPSVGAFAKRWRRASPDEAGREIVTEYGKVINAVGISMTPASLPALALTHLFGEPGAVPTVAEVAAYAAAGLIH